MIFRIFQFHLLLDCFLLVGLCLAREPETSADSGAKWVVGVVIGSMVFIVIIIIIIVCCVCKKSVGKGLLIRPVENCDRDVHGLNKSVYQVGHFHHHHQHHDHQQGHGSGIHYDVNGHPIGLYSEHGNGNNTELRTLTNVVGQNVQIPSISVSHHSPEVTMDTTSLTQENQVEQSDSLPVSDIAAETMPPQNT